MKRITFLIIAIFASNYAQTQQIQGRNDSLLLTILNTTTSPILKEVISKPSTYRVQIIYTRIDRDKRNKPSFTNYYFNYNPHLYFNPASMVKMPLAFLSLEKLHKLRKAGVDKYTTLVFDSSQPWHRKLYADTTAASGNPSIAHFIKRAFLISENDPYNRMYQWLGQERINQRLHSLGYKDVRITRQFLGLTAAQNRITPPTRFLSNPLYIILNQDERVNKDSFDFSQRIVLGDAHMDRRDSLIKAPFDFTEHNNISLLSLQQMLQAVLFPKSFPKTQRFDLEKDDYRFLYQWMSAYPSETDDPKYDTSVFYDSYVKFFFRDSTKKMPPNVRVFNKVGWSYGFLTDVSYVADFYNGVEFMLSATVYVNSDGVINDGKYEYRTVGWPFLYQLGQAIYKHELSRHRRYKPDLTEFRINYGRRNPSDTRKPLKEVDN